MNSSNSKTGDEKSKKELIAVRLCYLCAAIGAVLWIYKLATLSTNSHPGLFMLTIPVGFVCLFSAFIAGKKRWIIFSVVLMSSIALLWTIGIVITYPRV